MPVTEPIRVGKDTKEELKKLKIHPRETYDDVVRRLIEVYKLCRQKGVITGMEFLTPHEQASGSGGGS